MTNKDLLRSKVVLVGDDFKTLCKKIGMYSATFHSKLRGKTEFKQTEIQKIMQVYNLTADEIVKIFLSGEEK